LLVAACTLTTSLDGLTGGAVGPGDGEGGSDGSFTEGSVADRVELPGPVGTSTVIATDVGGLFAAGSSQQTHLHYAKNAGQWILFYLSEADATHLRARMSRDFATWTDGAALSLPQPHNKDGRNFAVAYADVGGRDVFHISLSLKPGNSDRRHHHVRATVESGALVYETPTELGKVTLSETTLDPDGPAVAVLPDGKVFDLAGWYAPDGGTARTGNIVSWESTTNDTAASWPSTFAPPFEVEVVDIICNGRALLTTPAGALALWESADSEPNPTSVNSARYENGTWRPKDTVGFEKTRFDPNDWGAAALAADVHAVRFAGSTYSHRIFTAGTWHAGSGIPPRAHPVAQGVVVVADGSTLLAISLDTDGGVASTSLVNGAWMPWKTELSGGAMRTQLSGYSGVAGVAVAWVETAGNTKSVVGARLR